MTMPTVAQAESLSLMAAHFNAELFDEKLDMACIIICWTRAHQVVGGHFATNKWEGENGQRLHELAINANVMKSMTLTQLAAVLVHEMQHAHDVQEGVSGRAGYHAAHFCTAMAEIGLPQIDVSTGERIKQGSGAHSCENLILPEPTTLFNMALMSLPEDAVPPYSSDPDPQEQPKDCGEGEEPEQEDAEPAEPKKKPGSRAKFTCVSCGLNAWAKPGALLLCGCNAQALIEQS